MGMFDSIYIDCKCPRCGETSKMEFQTKDLNCNLNGYKPGDNIGTTKYKYLDTIASCHSKSCMQFEKDEYKSRVVGFGYTFDANVFIDDEGVITGDFVIKS